MVHAGHLGVIHPLHFGMVHASHLGVIHPCHRTVIHGHAHVSHGQNGALTKLRNFTAHSFPRGKGAGGIAGTSQGRGEDRICLLLLRLNDDVVCLSDGNAKLVDSLGLDVVSIRLYNGHLQTWNPHIEIGHRGPIDETEANPLARPE